MHLRFSKLFALVLLPFFCSFAQDPTQNEIVLDSSFTISISPKLPKYAVHIVEVQRTLKSEDEYSINISLLNSQDRSLNQSINSSWTSYRIDMQSSQETSFEFVDLNFDGFLDLLVSQGESVDGLKVDNVFWLFDPNTRQFQSNPQMSDHFRDRFSCSSLDKELTTGGRTGCVGRCYEFEHYRWNGSVLILFSKESQEQTEDGTGFVHEKSQLINGEMKVIEHEIIKD